MYELYHGLVYRYDHGRDIERDPNKVLA